LALVLSVSEAGLCCVLGLISEKDSDNGRGKFDIKLIGEEYTQQAREEGKKERW
jgi:hypothetical protein